MLREWFDDQMFRMSALKARPADMDEHYRQLQDVPTQVLDAGVTHAIRTRAWFPTVAELRADCDAANVRPMALHPTSHLVPINGAKMVTIDNPFGGASITVAVTQEPYYHCDGCDDTGVIKRWCGDAPSARWPWLTHERCGRRHPHPDHDWAGACPCASINPVILRRKESQGMKFSREPERVS